MRSPEPCGHRWAGEQGSVQALDFGTEALSSRKQTTLQCSSQQGLCRVPARRCAGVLVNVKPGPRVAWLEAWRPGVSVLHRLPSSSPRS